MKKRTKAEARPAPAAAESPKSPGIWEKSAGILERYAVWISVALVLIATLRIAATYSVLSFTYDEPAHIACGMEWLDQHVYRYEPQHPPLTRAMVALLPYLNGTRSMHKKVITNEGIALFADEGHLDQTLALSRAGNLPFFWITCWVAFLFTVWITGSRAAAVMAVFLTTMTPAILAHSGLATTDMGLTAFLMLAFYTGWKWIEEATWKRAMLFGAALGTSLLCKFSTLAFFPVVTLFALAGRWFFLRPAMKDITKDLGPRVVQMLAASALIFFMVWAAYWFSFGEAPYVSFKVPAPEVLQGIKQVQDHNAGGHVTYLMGESNATGWALFYVIALGVKTPLPILVLALGGLWLLCSPKNFGVRGWILPSIVLGIVIYSSLFSNIQIGTRHVMPVYVVFAIAGACATLVCLRSGQMTAWKPYMVAAVGVLIAGISIAAHPDYLGYFNVLAGDRPERILVDSDLDWGQDMKRLGKRLQEAGAKEVYFNQMGAGDMRKLYGFPEIHMLDVKGPHPGWNAVSLTPMKLGLFGDTRYVYDPGFQFWADQMQPTEKVGTGILLFYLPGK